MPKIINKKKGKEKKIKMPGEVGVLNQFLENERKLKEQKVKDEMKDLETLTNLAVNVRKLAKFQKQDAKDRLYPQGKKEKSIELFKIYEQLIEEIIKKYEQQK
jgi:hypothetical protein